jgi:hypothetical protein
MPTILRTIGGNFRLVGPLTLTNSFANPSFESVTGSVPDMWTPLVNTTLTKVTTPVKFGNSACRVDIAAGSVTNKGLVQTLPEPVIPGQSYSMSAWVNLPSGLPSPLLGQVTFFDSGSNQIGSTFFQTLSLGGVSANYSQVAYLNIIPPDGAVTASAGLSVNTGSIATFYVDGMMWGTSTSYVDGDFAGYVWSGVPLLSSTRQSTAPDALNFFSPDVTHPNPVIS